MSVQISHHHFSGSLFLLLNSLVFWDFFRSGRGRLMPGRSQYPPPVFAAYLGQIAFTISGVSQPSNELLQARRVADLGRHGRAVEVRSECHALYPDLLDQMVDMPDHVGNRRVGVLTPVRPQHADGEVQPDQSLALAYGVELPVGQVARD